MAVTADLINGIAVGVEYLPGEDEEFYNTVILDLLIIRLLIQW